MRFLPDDETYQVLKMTAGVRWLLLLMGCYSAPLWADDFISQIKTEYQSVLEKSFILLPHRGCYFIPLRKLPNCLNS